MCSQPLEISEEVYNAFKPLLSQEDPPAYLAKQASRRLNDKALTNNCLARVLPLAVWLSSLQSNENIKTMILNEVELSHPNKTIQELAFVYVMTIKYLMTNQGEEKRAQKAFELALKIAKGPRARTIDASGSSCLSFL